MKEKSILGLLLGLCSYIVGSINITTIAFFVFMGIDFLTGIMGSKANGEKYDADKAAKGAFKKFAYIILWAVAVIFELVVIQQGKELGLNLDIPLALFMAGWLMATELLSILQNLEKLGVKPPGFFSKPVEKLKDQFDDKDGE